MSAELRPGAGAARSAAQVQAEVDAWVAELAARGALDEATTDVFERVVDDWVREQLAALESGRVERQALHARLEAEAEAELVRREQVLRRAEREHATVQAALDRARGAAPPSSAPVPSPRAVNGHRVLHLDGAGR